MSNKKLVYLLTTVITFGVVLSFISFRKIDKPSLVKLQVEGGIIDRYHQCSR